MQGRAVAFPQLRSDQTMFLITLTKQEGLAPPPPAATAAAEG